MRPDAGSNIEAVYYDPSKGPWRYLPFLVAPVARFQDVVLLGPHMPKGGEDDFIGAVYSDDIGDRLQRPTIRLFHFQGRHHVAIILPTSVRDEGGRTGLKVTLGFALRAAPDECGVAAYFRAMARCFERVVGVGLTVAGAERFAQHLQGSDSRVWQRVRDYSDALLLHSELVAAIQPRPAWSIMRRIKRSLRPSFGAGIVLHPELELADLVGLLSGRFRGGTVALVPGDGPTAGTASTVALAITLGESARAFSRAEVLEVQDGWCVCLSR